MAEPEFRLAVRADLPAIVALLADDGLGAARETTTVGPAYRRAFDAIAADPGNELVVAERAGAVVGTCQLTYTPSLSRHGALRLTIEAVRVRSDQRGRGTGAAMMRWALDRGRSRGCGLAQLTTDKRRADAHRFYARLGFAATHEGMKLTL